MLSVPLAKMEALTLTGLQGQKLLMRPAMIASVSAGPETRINTLDGSATLVKETPAQISAMMAAGGRKMLPGAAAYSGLKSAIDDGELQQFLNGDDSKALWIEALRETASSSGRSRLSRLLGIYGKMLSPFNFFRSFSSDSGRPSPLEAELNAKGFQRSNWSRR